MWWAPSSLGFYYTRAPVCPCPSCWLLCSPTPQLQKHLRRFPSVSFCSYAVSHSKKCIDLGSYTDLRNVQARKLLLGIWMPSNSGLFFLSSLTVQSDIREELEAVVKGCLKGTSPGE